jgi:NAD(P)-dependent dehydrogenase (short-subunit alcohol dehydrogenase family)
MSTIAEGRVAVVTGAGTGLGRSHALELARQGARVVVNDTGPSANQTVEEIHDGGGIAAASVGDVADWEYSASLINFALETYGGLDALVNNAGLVRDRMFVNMSEEEWDLVMRVDLKGHFCPLRHAAAYWRQQSKSGNPVSARVINTTSGAGLLGSVGQANYAAAKAGVAALTLVTAVELAPYQVTVNAIAPAARTSMTEAVFAATMTAPDSGFDTMSPDNVSPLVAWLASVESGDVTGRVFEVSGGIVSVADGWQPGPRVDKEERWKPAELGPVIRALLLEAPAPAPVYSA